MEFLVTKMCLIILVYFLLFLLDITKIGIFKKLIKIPINIIYFYQQNALIKIQ